IHITISFFIAGEVLAISLEQYQLSITIKESGRTARIRCKVLPKGTVNSQQIHWYQQKGGESMKRLLYSRGRVAEYDQESYKKKFSVDINDEADECTLSVLKPEKSDNGKYFCAFWDSHS
ncbi:VPRE3 protein, partial [Polyodon spathula]|nr:VPRE3 protein [Polyodon spathula]